jgi:large subunit ribosomal protein L18
LARSSTYNIPYRRKREGRTDYKKRKALILSGLPRLVIRGTNKHLIAQIVEARASGDHVIASANSIELRRKLGWRGGCGNVPAAYLTGLLIGRRAKQKGVEKAVLDIGLRRASVGSRVFAALKGSVDAGLNIPHEESVFPDESRIRGDHIADYAKKLTSTPELYDRYFSQYLARELKPEELPQHFDEVKQRLLQLTFKAEDEP